VGGHPARIHPFHNLVPLPEVLGEFYQVGAGSKQVEQEYNRLLSKLGPELVILRETPLEDIAAAASQRLAEGIGRMRRGQVVAQGGYDGEYGVIRVFGAGPAGVASEQMSLFETAADSTANGGAKDITTYETPHGSAVDSIPERIAPSQAVWASSIVPPPTAISPSTLHAPLSTLNPQQRAAVLCVDAPLIVVAGPGTGKTRTLTVRLAYLIEALGAPPESILAITFTNKAAGEMAERLESLLGQATAERVTVKTFHAFGALLLRQFGERLGLTPQFAILSDDDRHTLLRQACPELNQKEIEQALAQISTAKSRLIEPAAAGPDLAATYASYEAALRTSQSVDFDDLIRLPVRLLEVSPDALRAMQDRFRWISVDEYQDVNLAQVRLLRLLANAGANVCAIGDPDQAIYGFRGAERRYFFEFAQDFPGAKILSLAENYRSTQMILDAAMQVIGSGGKRGQEDAKREDSLRLRAVDVVSEFAEQVKLDVVRTSTDKAEAESVVHQIEQMVGGTSYFSLDSGRVEGAGQVTVRSFADFAVLYRLGAQSRLLGEAFERSGIPYQTIGQKPLAAHKPVREILATLWLMHTPQSRVHLETVLDSLAVKVSEKSLDDLSKTLELAAADAPGTSARLSEEANQRSVSASERRKRLEALAPWWAEIDRARRAGLPVARLIEQVHAFLTAQRGAAADAGEARLVHQLVLRAAPFDDDLGAFLEATVLQSETDAYDPRADRVTLMTLHAAKGLEFPVVFIVGCEEGLLPYARPDEAADADEERRLFYVGLTRAQRRVVLLHADKRLLYGQPMTNPVSRFVGDIEAALKEVQQTQRRPAAPKPAGVQLELFGL
jgi:superfamily I DNA/RNA helicase